MEKDTLIAHIIELRNALHQVLEDFDDMEVHRLSPDTWKQIQNALIETDNVTRDK